MTTAVAPEIRATMASHLALTVLPPQPTGATSPQATEAAAVLAPAPPEAITTGRGSRAATGLQSQVRCEAGQPTPEVAYLSWVPAAELGTAQRVDVTIYSFEYQFDRSDSLRPDQSSLAWRQLHGHAIHLWRVLTQHGEEWESSALAEFTGPVCPDVNMISGATPAVTP
jgi:hypothetical protein